MRIAGASRRAATAGARVRFSGRAPPPDDPPPYGNGAGDRIVTRIDGKTAYLVAGAGTRYFTGSVLPSGHTIRRITPRLCRSSAKVKSSGFDFERTRPPGVLPSRQPDFRRPPCIATASAGTAPRRQSRTPRARREPAQTCPAGMRTSPTPGALRSIDKRTKTAALADQMNAGNDGPGVALQVSAAAHQLAFLSTAASNGATASARPSKRWVASNRSMRHDDRRHSCQLSWRIGTSGGIGMATAESAERFQQAYAAPRMSTATSRRSGPPHC